MDRLRGRTDDMLIVKGVNFYPRQVETAILKFAALGPEYQIVLESDHGGERMTVLVECEREPAPPVVARMRRELHELVQVSPEIRFLALGALERPQGKAIRVVDRRATR